MDLKAQSKQPKNILPSLRGKKILVVDDDADTRLLFTYLFEDCGAAVLAACSAQEALTTLEQWQPHLLISNIGMPNGDGHSLIKRVRELKPSCGVQIPAIAVTGYVGDALDYSPEDFQLYLTKPVDLDALLVAASTLVKQETLAD